MIGVVTPGHLVVQSTLLAVGRATGDITRCENLIPLFVQMQQVKAGKQAAPDFPSPS